MFFIFLKLKNNGEPVIVFKTANNKFYYLKSGTSYIPSIDEEGNLSWSNNDGQENPPTVNIKGKTGDKGGIFIPAIDENCNLTWSNDADLSNPEPVNLKPVAGIDFFTEEDKSKIISDIVKELNNTVTYSNTTF